jgi:hypothetical protein
MRGWQRCALFAVVVQLVSFTYQSITKDEFCSLTNLDAAKADALAKVQVHCHASIQRRNYRHHGLAHRARCCDVQSQGWNVTATSYEIPVNAENQAKSRNISENISIDRTLPTATTSVRVARCMLCVAYCTLYAEEFSIGRAGCRPPAHLPTAFLGTACLPSGQSASQPAACLGPLLWSCGPVAARRADAICLVRLTNP